MSSTRRPKRFLSPEQKYDLWLRMLTGQLNQTDAAAEAGVDRNTIAMLRKVAKDGAIAALTASAPGRRRQSAPESSELAKLRAEVDRLGGVIIEQAIELAALRGKTSWG
ncbi:MAG: helix-turn-helix domain-containing protein [Acidimicrobiales bacterium]